MAALEETILGYVIVNRFQPAQLGLEKDFFKNELQRKVFNEIEKGNYQLDLLVSSIGGNGTASKLASWTDGVPNTKPKDVVRMINRVRAERLNHAILKQIQAGANSGHYDHDKIRGLYDHISALQNHENPIKYFGLDTVDPKPIVFTWHNKIPSGVLSLFAGDPGDGKTTVAIDAMARISTGTDWPDAKNPYMNEGRSVFFMTAEDGLGDVIRVRADEAGANVSKIKIVETVVQQKDRAETFDIRKHLQFLEKAIEKEGDVKLVVFDPITAYLGDLEDRKNTQVRAALAPLAALAEKHNLAIIGITHLNKDQAKKALYRAMGSIAFTAAARSVWLVSRDEEDPTGRRRFFTPLKANMCKNPSGLAFLIDGPLGRPKVIWEPDPIDRTASELLLDEEGRERHGALREAKQFLVEALKDGPQPSRNIHEEAKSCGIAEKTLNRAKSIMNVRSYQRDRQWYWEMVR